MRRSTDSPADGDASSRVVADHAESPQEAHKGARFRVKEQQGLLKRRGWDSNPRNALRRSTAFETAPLTTPAPLRGGIKAGAAGFRSSRPEAGVERALRIP